MSTSRIKHVTIEKLWGIKTISSDFFEDVNIFVGVNGSSKTTFLKLIEASLLVEIDTLANIDFGSIIIEFSDSETRILKISKEIREDGTSILYSFDDAELYNLPNYESNVRPYRIHPRVRENFLLIKRKIESIISISWISVNRGDVAQPDFDHRESMERQKDLIDSKVYALSRDLAMFQLQLESDANTLSKKFKEEVMSLMLYNEEFDSYSNEVISRFSSIDTDAMKDDLFRAFKAMGIEKDKKNSIVKHIQSIKEAIERVQVTQQIKINDVFVLALIKRTLSIITISKEHENQTKNIFLPIENFKSYLKGFMPDKEFLINTVNGSIDISLLSKSNGVIPINLYSLSSGEKQLFILLTEALLQREKPYIFIADEPELSLHIGWQKRVLGELLKLNSNAQIIVATHSPEIAGNFPDKVINMNSIVQYV